MSPESFRQRFALFGFPQDAEDLLFCLMLSHGPVDPQGLSLKAAATAVAVPVVAGITEAQVAAIINAKFDELMVLIDDHVSNALDRIPLLSKMEGLLSPVMVRCNGGEVTFGTAARTTHDPRPMHQPTPELPA